MKNKGFKSHPHGGNDEIPIPGLNSDGKNWKYLRVSVVRTMADFMRR